MLESKWRSLIGRLSQSCVFVDFASKRDAFVVIAALQTSPSTLMDETLKPLRIPPEISVYADQHHLSHLVQSMVSSLLVQRPGDPISFLIRFLQRRRLDGPRVMLLGPPAVGKHSLAKALSAELGAVLVTPESLQQGPVQLDGSAEVLVRLLLERLKEEDCFHRGWILDGIPQTRLQVLLLQRAGIMPEHVVLLEAPEEVLLQRSRGRLWDPVTGDIYHQMFVQPGDGAVAQRLERGRGLSEEQLLAELQSYRCEVTALKSAYQHVLKVVDGDQPPMDVYQQVLTFVRTRRLFRTPRVLLIGPPGSGKSFLARRVSEKYQVVNVSCGRLLRSAAADCSGLGVEIRQYLDNGRPVPDSLVLQVLEDRLSRADCGCRGWVLHGFPSDLLQARRLQDSRYRPNRVFLLDVPDDVCLERLSLRARDPISGERFHAVTRPAPSAEIQSRLRTAPEDAVEAVRHRLDRFRVRSAPLQSFYPDAVHLDADQNPQSVLEALESRLYTN